MLDNFERAADAITTETDREASIQARAARASPPRVQGPARRGWPADPATGSCGGQASYQGVNKEFLKILTKLGVEPIEAEGQEFDPNLHQAIQQAESTEYPENTVSKCARPPPFLFGGK